MADDIDNKVEFTEKSLGEYLRSKRLEKGLDVNELVAETKISVINLHAIEEDDYSTLPSITFSRGLYTIYAKALDLDVQEILNRFSEESNQTTVSEDLKPTPSRLVKEVGAMAERPPAPPTSFLGLLFIVLIIIIAGFCWYFSVNPATFLSEKLRGLQNTSQSIEPAIQEENEYTEATIEPEQEISAAVEVTETSIEQPATIASQPETVGPKYTLSVQFTEPTEVFVTVDDEFQKKLSLTANKETSWTAEQSIDLIFPESSNGILKLNEKEVVLPKAENGKIIISIPEYLFE